MANVAVSKSVRVSLTSKKIKKTVAVTSKKPEEKGRAHPPASEMVIAAITALGDKKGSSLQAIKKYIAGHYVCDVEKQALFIRKFIKSAVEKKTLVQTKGLGASGSFKLAKLEKTTNKKPAAETSVSKKSTKKPTASKKVIDAKQKVAKSSKPKSSAMKKTGKSSAVKPKAKKATSNSAKK